MYCRHYFLAMRINIKREFCDGHHYKYNEVAMGTEFGSGKTPATNQSSGLAQAARVVITYCTIHYMYDVWS